MALGSRDPLGFLIQLYQFQRLKNTLRFNAKSDLTGFKTASFVPDYHGLTWRKHGLPFWKMTWPSNTVGWNNQLLRQPELASHTFHRPWVLRVVLRPCESGTRRGGGPVTCVYYALQVDPDGHSSLGTTSIGHIILYLKFVISNPKVETSVASNLNQI